MNRGERQHHEQCVNRRRMRRSPGYVQKHPGKTPGKVCSCECCGNPRRHSSKPHEALTHQELVAALDDGGDPEIDVVSQDEIDDVVYENYGPARELRRLVRVKLGIE